jgi:hypothetical protein
MILLYNCPACYWSRRTFPLDDIPCRKLEKLHVTVKGRDDVATGHMINNNTKRVQCCVRWAFWRRKIWQSVVFKRCLENSLWLF